MNVKKIYLTEAQLVAALQNKEVIGIHALNDMYSKILGAILNKLLNNPESTKDALQEVIVKIWYSADKYDPVKGCLFTWMLNITKNYAIDILRSKSYKDHKRHSNIDDYYVPIDWHNEIAFNPDIILIRELVYRLKPKFHILLELVYFKGYTHLETAAVLNLPLGTVKTRIRMAINELKLQFD